MCDLAVTIGTNRIPRRAVTSLSYLVMTGPWGSDRALESAISMGLSRVELRTIANTLCSLWQNGSTDGGLMDGTNGKSVVKTAISVTTHMLAKNQICRIWPRTVAKPSRNLSWPFRIVVHQPMWCFRHICVMSKKIFGQVLSKSVRRKYENSWSPRISEIQV